MEGPVDAIALSGALSAQQVINGWWPRRFSVVPVATEQGFAQHSGASGVGSFFSGGVDSFYTAITQSDRITHLIFVHGFDIKISDGALADAAQAAAREAAADLGKPLVEVTTTIRSAFGDPLRMAWGNVYHGPSLAHVGLALAPHIKRVLVPSSNSRDQLSPWGSHPDLDPCWSSSEMAVEHHELDVGRIGKIRRLGDSETAMAHLRVCWHNTNGSYNCGHCAKCIRTKLGLMVAGAESPMLPGPIDPNTVRRMFVSPGERKFLREALTAVVATGRRDADLEKALRFAIRRSYLRRNVFA
ncbi:hypothetical protein QMK17_01040 [Rhodococcus sp. G-MC3]|uniref:hypothetical protein n=1 Tax=Rhodococcus sp. G-MC3 TaxID=3046209 RepID=UPI0024BB1987|nr:hypothetical protein [Rhodococcus sp. G-MC3]MDJ0391916.1 hypothetical protein [Rhodococcus sp. G-MC3]